MMLAREYGEVMARQEAVGNSWKLKQVKRKVKSINIVECTDKQINFVKSKVLSKNKNDRRRIWIVQRNYFLQRKRICKIFPWDV